MKTRILLFAIAAITLLSFSFVSSNQTEEKAVATQQETLTMDNQGGGIILEDNAAW